MKIFFGGKKIFCFSVAALKFFFFSVAALKFMNRTIQMALLFGCVIVMQAMHDRRNVPTSVSIRICSSFRPPPPLSPYAILHFYRFFFFAFISLLPLLLLLVYLSLISNCDRCKLVFDFFFFMKIFFHLIGVFFFMSFYDIG